MSADCLNILFVFVFCAAFVSVSAGIQQEMAKKRPGLGAGEQYMRLALIIGSFFYGVSKTHTHTVV